MTLDELVAAAADKIDAVLQQRWDDLAMHMIATGCNPNDPPNPPDDSGPWRRVTFDEVVQHQKALDCQWWWQMLAQLRMAVAAALEKRNTAAPRND